MNESTYVFKPHLWSTYKRWALPLVVIPIWALLANIDHLTDRNFWHTGFLIVGGFFIAALAIPALRILFVRHRRIEIGNNWIQGPTQDLFVSRKICDDDLAKIEVSEDGEKIQIRSKRGFAIIVILKDYDPRRQDELRQLILSFRKAVKKKTGAIKPGPSESGNSTTMVYEYGKRRYLGVIYWILVISGFYAFFSSYGHNPLLVSGFWMVTGCIVVSEVTYYFHLVRSPQRFEISNSQLVVEWPKLGRTLICDLEILEVRKSRLFSGAKVFRYRGESFLVFRSLTNYGGLIDAVHNTGAGD